MVWKEGSKNLWFANLWHDNSVFHISTWPDPQLQIYLIFMSMKHSHRFQFSQTNIPLPPHCLHGLFQLLPPIKGKKNRLSNSVLLTIVHLISLQLKDGKWEPSNVTSHCCHEICNFILTFVEISKWYFQILPFLKQWPFDLQENITCRVWKMEKKFWPNTFLNPS